MVSPSKIQHQEQKQPSRENKSIKHSRMFNIYAHIYLYRLMIEIIL